MLDTRTYYKEQMDKLVSLHSIPEDEIQEFYTLQESWEDYYKADDYADEYLDDMEIDNDAIEKWYIDAGFKVLDYYIEAGEAYSFGEELTPLAKYRRGYEMDENSAGAVMRESLAMCFASASPVTEEE